MIGSLLDELCFLKQATTKDLVPGTVFCFFQQGKRKRLVTIVFLKVYDHSSKVSLYLPQKDSVQLFDLGYEEDYYTPNTCLVLYIFSQKTNPRHQLFLYPNPKTLREKLAFKMRTVLTSW